MSQKIKFFDVECANGRAYDFKELRQILCKVFSKRVERIRVYRTRRPVAGEIARVVIELHENSALYFDNIQQDDLDEYGISMLEIAHDGTAVALSAPVVDINPATIPISVQVVARTKRGVSGRRLRRPAAA